MNSPNHSYNPTETPANHPEPMSLLEDMQRRASEEDRLRPEVVEWAGLELTRAQEPLNKYGADWQKASEVFLAGPNASKKLSYLHEAQRRIAGAITQESHGGFDVPRTPKGVPINETMHLVYVPWKQMLDTLTGEGMTPSNWLLTGRVKQLGAAEEYGFGMVMDQLRVGSIVYRAPFRREPDDPSGWIDGKGYLRKRIEEDGDWGVILAQTTADAGIVGSEWEVGLGSVRLDYGASALPRACRAPSEMRCATVGKVEVGNLGVFEMAAITLAQPTSPASALPVYQERDGEVFSKVETLPANLNPLNRTVPQLQAHDGNLYWSAHYGENEAMVDAYMRLCVV